MNIRLNLTIVSRLGISIGLALFLLLLLLLLIDSPAQASTADSVNIIAITENGFNPSVITVETGSAVVWVNQTQQTIELRSGEPYRIYLPLIICNVCNISPFIVPPPGLPIVGLQDQNQWADVTLAPGQSYTRTFTFIDDYPFFLGTQPGQTSLVKVIAKPTPASPLFETVLWVANESGYANTPDNTSLDLGRNDGEDFTIETFFYVPASSNDDPFTDLLTRKDKSYLLFISFNNSQPDAVSFRLWTAAEAEITLTYFTNLSPGWHHLATVFDNEFTANEDLMAIYLDGSRVANSADENIHVDWTPGIPNSSSELLVGGVPFGSAGFNGLIEEIRFSDIVRYSGDSYTIPTTPFSNDANTRTLWHFDEAAGSTTFNDASDNDNTLTGHNGAQTHNP